MDGQVLHYRLRGGDDAVPAARKVLRDAEAEEGLPNCEDLPLLVSELVTNSVRHAPAGPEEWLDLRFRHMGGRVRVGVCDESTGWQPPRDPAPGPEEPGGWGLFIVDRLSDRWGLSRGGGAGGWFGGHPPPAAPARRP